MDSIRLEKLRFYGYHGVLPEENRLGQPFLVTMEIFLDLAKAGKSDDLSQTLDYGKVAEITRNLVEGPPVKLLEHLAHKLIETLFSEFPEIRQIHLSIDKPAPPLPQSLTSVGITLRRQRVIEA